MICYDIFSPSVIAQYEDQGIKILFVLSNMVVPSQALFERQKFLVGEAFPAWTAAQLNCFMAISMLSGDDVISCSQVVSPTKGVIDRLDNEEGLVVAELSLEHLNFFPFLDVKPSDAEAYVKEKFPENTKGR